MTDTLRHTKTQENTAEEGNTKTSSRSRKWVITLNNYSSEEYKELLDTLNTRFYKYIVGRKSGSRAHRISKDSL